MDGFLVINKPVGCTSFHVVAQVRKRLHTQKVGHAGTLDPFAHGVLLVAVGKALRLLEYMQGLPKVYVLTVCLGKESSTLDTEGEVIERMTVDHLTRNHVEEALSTFLGESLQVPPQHSALRIQGKRAYEFARKGKVVALEKRKIFISHISLVEFSLPYIKVRVACSSGSYMRSLARDIGEVLSVGGYAVELCRESVGEFCLDMSTKVEEVSESSKCIGVSTVKLPYDTLELSTEESLLFLNGVKLPLFDLAKEGTMYQVRKGETDELLGVAFAHEGFLKIKKILAHIPTKASVA